MLGRSVTRSEDRRPGREAPERCGPPAQRDGNRCPRRRVCVKEAPERQLEREGARVEEPRRACLGGSDRDTQRNRVVPALVRAQTTAREQRDREGAPSTGVAAGHRARVTRARRGGGCSTSGPGDRAFRGSGWPDRLGRGSSPRRGSHRSRRQSRPGCHPRSGMRASPARTSLVARTRTRPGGRCAATRSRSVPSRPHRSGRDHPRTGSDPVGGSGALRFREWWQPSARRSAARSSPCRAAAARARSCRPGPSPSGARLRVCLGRP